MFNSTWRNRFLLSLAMRTTMPDAALPGMPAGSIVHGTTDASLAFIGGNSDFVNHLAVQSALTGNDVGLFACGADANVGMQLVAKGTGAITLVPGAGGVVILGPISFTGDVDITGNLTVTGDIEATSTIAPQLRVEDALDGSVVEVLRVSHILTNTAQPGIGARITLGVETDGFIERDAASFRAVVDDVTDGAEQSHVGVYILAFGSAGEALRVRGPAGAAIANRLAVVASVAASSPSIEAEGADADINIILTPKGSGVVNILGPAVVASTLSVSASAQSSIVRSDAAQNTPLRVLTLTRTAGGLAGVAGIGASLALAATNDAVGNVQAGELRGVLDTVGAGFEQGRLALAPSFGGTAYEVLSASAPVTAIVNGLEVRGAATLDPVYLVPRGEANVSMRLRAKGTGSILFRNPADSLTVFGIVPNAAETFFGLRVSTTPNVTGAATITCDTVAGTVRIPNGQTTRRVDSALVTAASVILITPRSPMGAAVSFWYVADATGFDIFVDADPTMDVDFGFFITNAS